MIVKIMSDEDLPDSDSRKAYVLVETQKVKFSRDDDDNLVVTALLSYPTDQVVGGCFTTSEELIAYGNVYVMNDNGKTIDTVSPNKVKGSRIG